MSIRERAAQIRYNLIPGYLIGELLTKRWIDNVIPLLFLLILLPVLNHFLPGFLALASLTDISRQWGEFALVVMGLSIVMLGGGLI